MANASYKYELCHELTDCSLSKSFSSYSSKRTALRIARHCAKQGAGDALNVVVMDNVQNTVVGVFPIARQEG